MAVLQLADLTWRVDPNSVQWNFQLDTSVIDTLGGQVVQILGATLSDLVISGDFGQDHQANTPSWRLAAAFHQKIKSLMDAQALPAKTVAQSQSKTAHKQVNRTGILSDAGTTHSPMPLTYRDGVHNWAFKVLIKDIRDGTNGDSSFTIRNERYNYNYVLTLFIVEADSEKVKQVASDLFLSRISEGLGWSQSDFNGPLSSQGAQDFIAANGGTISAFLDKVLTGQSLTDPGAITATGPPSGGSMHSKAQ